MKRPVLLFLLLIFVVMQTTAQVKINFQNAWGVNLINLEDATGTPKFDDSLPAHFRQLVDWSRFYYNMELQVLKSVNDQVDLGIAIGMNRLYYWEERYRGQFDTSFQFDYGTIWTYEVSGVVNYYVEESWFMHGTVGAHLFEVDDSATIGLGIGAGHNISVSDQFTIPVLLKTDFIFGDGTTIAPNLGVGLMFTF